MVETVGHGAAREAGRYRQNGAWLLIAVLVHWIFQILQGGPLSDPVPIVSIGFMVASGVAWIVSIGLLIRSLPPGWEPTDIRRLAYLAQVWALWSIVACVTYRLFGLALRIVSIYETPAETEAIAPCVAGSHLVVPKMRLAIWVPQALAVAQGAQVLGVASGAAANPSITTGRRRMESSQ
ncbi:hypothetical protein HII36_44000 [Nonomuraea sp. NN258]|uniref:hypothetical protein n=1 Tax=Nonomuraea antri TaxID=2730852 RepID=UPI0015693604|nr:hypothetical protein [Nonomuraea antri]NRQ38743.1 hypothetical protein [Nonomuraea antri]